MSVHYKFKASKEYDTVNFPGTVIRVIDLKKAIVEKKKLNKGLDFDLVITDAQNNTGMMEFFMDMDEIQWKFMLCGCFISI